MLRHLLAREPCIWPIKSVYTPLCLYHRHLPSLPSVTFWRRGRPCGKPSSCVGGVRHEGTLAAVGSSRTPEGAVSLAVRAFNLVIQLLRNNGPQWHPAKRRSLRSALTLSASTTTKQPYCGSRPCLSMWLDSRLRFKVHAEKVCSQAPCT